MNRVFDVKECVAWKEKNKLVKCRHEFKKYLVQKRCMDESPSLFATCKKCGIVERQKK